MAIDSLDGVKPGDIYLGDDGDIYEVESLCIYPTITLRNVLTSLRINGAVGSPLLKPFQRLVSEKPEDGNP